MRILHVGHQQLRKYGQVRVSWVKKLCSGYIKNDHNVYAFSERDVAAYEAPFKIRDLGVRRSNKKLIQTAVSFEPELIVLGHCDMISNDTILKIRKLLPNTMVVGANVDPLFVPENVKNIQERCEVVDAMFVSTGVKELSIFEGKRAKLYHIPNPVDPAVETSKNYLKTDFEHDLIFCCKSDDYTDRGKLVRYLKDNINDSCDFYTPGMDATPGAWGRDYDKLLDVSKMGLNINRQEGYHWYSSDRIAQLAGNGLLVFTNSQACFDELFPENSLVYYDSNEQLKDLIEEFNADDSKRQLFAKNAYDYIHREMNITLCSQYIVEVSMGLALSHDYVWHR